MIDFLQDLKRRRYWVRDPEGNVRSHHAPRSLTTAALTCVFSRPQQGWEPTVSLARFARQHDLHRSHMAAVSRATHCPAQSTNIFCFARGGRG